MDSVGRKIYGGAGYDDVDRPVKTREYPQVIHLDVLGISYWIRA